MVQRCRARALDSTSRRDAGRRRPDGWPWRDIRGGPPCRCRLHGHDHTALRAGGTGASASASASSLSVVQTSRTARAFDYAAPIVRRTPHRAGVIKSPRPRAGRRHAKGTSMRQRPRPHRTGAHHDPLAARNGAWRARVTGDPGLGGQRHAVHTDKSRAESHREILSAGAFLEYDSQYRATGRTGAGQGGGAWLTPGRPDCPRHDAARRSYLASWRQDRLSGCSATSGVMLERGIRRP